MTTATALRADPAGDVGLLLSSAHLRYGRPYS
jgi:hypothetical protein